MLKPKHKPMKQILSILFFVCLITACKEQTKNANYASTIKEQGEKMAASFMQQDFNSFANYNYPKVVEMMGGKEKMVEVLESGIKSMQEQGSTFLNVTVGDPSDVITIGEELQCTVPQTTEMKVPDGRVVSESTLIAISSDKGANWYFFDTSGKDIATLKQTLPNLSDALVIPQNTKPVFTPNK